MATTAAEKRGRLEDAYDKCNGSLRKTLRAAEQLARQVISAGSIKSTKANNQEAVFQDYGPGQITSLEIAELYRELVDAYDEAFNFLTYCAKWGLDPFTIYFSFPPSGLVEAQTQIVTDDTRRFATLCAQFDIDPTTIIDQAIKYQTIFLWMMYFLVAVTEARSDYSLAIVGSGGSQFT